MAFPCIGFFVLIKSTGDMTRGKQNLHVIKKKEKHWLSETGVVPF